MLSRDSGKVIHTVIQILTVRLILLKLERFLKTSLLYVAIALPIELNPLAEFLLRLAETMGFEPTTHSIPEVLFN